MPAKKKNLDPVRAFLESAADAKREAAQHRLHLRTLRDRAENITAKYSAAPAGSHDPKSRDQLLALLAQESKIDDDLAIMEDVQYREVESFIRRLPNARDRAVLTARYLKGVSEWADVQKELRRMGIYYSTRQAQRLHGKALESARAQWAWEQWGGE